jgi:amino acid adenylation domain-containing protein
MSHSEDSTAATFRGPMSTSFSAIAEHPAKFPVAPRDERPQSSLADQFSTICAQHGQRTALTLDGTSVTYRELDTISNRIASSLLAQGATTGTIVAICLERSIEMIAAMLGVVKAGAAYLPIDPGYPVARISETLTDAAPIAVLTSAGLADRLHRLATPTLIVQHLIRDGAEDPIAFDTLPTDPAYVIYTSGSTGRPKGVVVSHANVSRLLTHTDRWFHFTPHDVWTLFHSFAFDFSVWEIWGTLLTGGRLVIVPFATSRSPEEFHALLVAEQVTVLNQTPSAFVLLDQADARMPLARLALRLVIFGGEALSPALLRGWFDRHGDRHPQMVNMYGITETTVHVTYRLMLAADATRERESLIGEPIGDLEIHLLDAHLKPVADGEEGEMFIGGAGVALGYLNRPALNTERFVTLDGQRLYRSGDLARRRADGELVYIGRSDSQVKISGYRIELGEIETALVTHPAVVQACVIAHAEPGGSPRLAAYYVAQYGREPGTRELSEYLAQRLPAQMMPAFYQRLAVFPLTPNGKVDRSALPRPSAGSALPDCRTLAAKTSLEDLVATIWCFVLKANAVSLDDNFFDVGGTSLLLIAVRTGLQEQLDRQIPVSWMFECTTVRSLARRLTESPAALEATPAPTADRTPELLQNRIANQRMAFARARAQRSVGR